MSGRYKWPDPPGGTTPCPDCSRPIMLAETTTGERRFNPTPVQGARWHLADGHMEHTPKGTRPMHPVGFIPHTCAGEQNREWLAAHAAEHPETEGTG